MSLILSLLSAYITDTKLVSSWMGKQWEKYLENPYLEIIFDLIRGDLSAHTMNFLTSYLPLRVISYIPVYGICFILGFSKD